MKLFVSSPYISDFFFSLVLLQIHIHRQIESVRMGRQGSLIPLKPSTGGHYLHDLYLFTPILILASVAPAAIFYSYYNGWDAMTSAFFSIQVVMGELYGTPLEASLTSQYVTMSLFMWGNLVSFSLFIFKTMQLLPLFCLYF